MVRTPPRRHAGGSPNGVLRELRTQIEKEGLPAVMAELVDTETGEVIADVACGEDEFGIWISGAVRRDEANQLVREQGELDRENILLRSFRLPDPPMSHLGQDLTDFRFVSLADLAIAYIRDRVVANAFAEFGDSSAADQSAG